MIIVRLDGGLGNQMFQYAVGRCLAEKLCSIVILDISEIERQRHRTYNLHCFNIIEAFPSTNEINLIHRDLADGEIFQESQYFDENSTGRIFKSGDNWEVINEQLEACGKFTPEVLNKTGNLYLVGYWQTEKYFLDIKPILLREFTLKFPLNAESLRVNELIRFCQSVSLHVRRGDYADDPHTNHYHGTCDITYYMNCINYISQYVEKPKIFVFSDDIEWVQHNLQIDFPVFYVDHNQDSNNYEDLFLMSQCEHNIIANSTFSWWAAWLNTNNKKIVCAPKRWFNNAPINPCDLIPSEWVKL